MKRYIAITAALLALCGCGKTEEAPGNAAPAVTEAQTEMTTETAPVSVKPDTADVRTYCVSLDAARNAILADYKDKIPEKLLSAFDANSSVLDEYMNKAAHDLTPEEAEQMFSELKKLEVFFCDTMAKEVGAGKKIEEISKAATHGADYYFEKIIEEASEETSEGETSDEDDTEDVDKEKSKKKSDDKEESDDKESSDDENSEDGTKETDSEKTEGETKR